MHLPFFYQTPSVTGSRPLKGNPAGRYETTVTKQTRRPWDGLSCGQSILANIRYLIFTTLRKLLTVFRMLHLTQKSETQSLKPRL